LTGRSSPRLLAAGLLLLLLVAAVAMLTLNRHGALPEASVAGDGARAEPLVAGAFNPSYAAPDFTLSGSDGSKLTLARFRGKVVVLTFGFTNCAAVCPTTLATLAQARKKLGTAADSMQVIYVTVDPGRDNAARLRNYLAAFDPSFIGATGAPQVLAVARQKYGVTAVKEGSGADYAMAHTSSIFLIDPASKLRAMMPFGHDAADFVHDVQYLSAH
jgi:protein SCO1/2